MSIYVLIFKNITFWSSLFLIASLSFFFLIQAGTGKIPVRLGHFLIPVSKRCIINDDNMLKDTEIILKGATSDQISKNFNIKIIDRNWL